MAFLLPEGRRSLSAYAYHVGPSHTYQPAYRFIAADIGNEHGAWLDMGTGTGWLAIHAGAGKPDLDVIGIDTSETMLSLAETNKAGRLNVTFRKMSADDVIYPAGTFTVVTAVQLFHHLGPERAKVLSEAHRTLVEGGKLYIYEADPESEVPADWVSRRAGWPTDGVLKGRWKKYGMDQSAWDQLKRDVEASPFGTGYTDERHGFYRRLVCTR